MRHTDLSQLEQLSQLDRYITRLEDWVNRDTDWEPAREAKLFLKRLLPRVQSVRDRLENPLVVALFGGTGTGKSTLVNALIGQELAIAGRERPTTIEPLLIAHSDIDLSVMDLPEDECRVLRCDQELLENLILLDCPDPDTTEGVTEESNLSRLRKLIPHCDVLIYTSTQQKYRSARVQQELLEAASGCRLVFVQTHADQDEDIRDDWRAQLSDDYEVPEMFYVDSQHSLKQQLNGQQPDEELRRLNQFLIDQLSASHRAQIRRSNVLDLILSALTRTQSQFGDYASSLNQLEQELAEQSQDVHREFSQQLKSNLLQADRLWERRLLDAVTQNWGMSPFSSLLRLYNSWGQLLGSLGLMRARTSAQVALIGMTQGARWIQQRGEENRFDQSLDQLSDLAIDDQMIEKKRMILVGYAREAGFTKDVVHQATASTSQPLAFIQEEFLRNAQTHVDQMVHEVSIKNTHWIVKRTFDLLFLILPAFLLFRIGKNFFWDSMTGDVPILQVEFYIAAGVFLLLWCWVFVMFFCRRLKRGLNRRIDEMIQLMLKPHHGASLFPDLEQVITKTRHDRDELQEMEQQIESLNSRHQYESKLGHRIPAKVTAS